MVSNTRSFPLRSEYNHVHNATKRWQKPIRHVTIHRWICAAEIRSKNHKTKAPPGMGFVPVQEPSALELRKPQSKREHQKKKNENDAGGGGGGGRSPLSRDWRSPNPSLIPIKHVLTSRLFRLSEPLEQPYIIPKQVIVGRRATSLKLTKNLWPMRGRLVASLNGLLSTDIPSNIVTSPCVTTLTWGALTPCKQALTQWLIKEPLIKAQLLCPEINRDCLNTNGWFSTVARYTKLDP